MSNNIVKIIQQKYSKQTINECIDITQLINICTLYKDNCTNSSISLNDIDFSSHEFKKPTKKISTNVIETSEFKNKYNFLIKIIYACLKMNIDIFEIHDDKTFTFKNNYLLIKSIEIQKKNILLDHISVLKKYSRCATHCIDQQYYDEYVPGYLIKIRILDKILLSIKKIIKANVVNNTDSLFTLILPYFYSYRKYIEEYNCT